MEEFKPQLMLDEQMQFWDAKTTLAYQIREEMKETNCLLRKLVKQNEEPEQGPEQEKPSKKG